MRLSAVRGKSDEMSAARSLRAAGLAVPGLREGGVGVGGERNESSWPWYPCKSNSCA